MYLIVHLFCVFLSHLIIYTYHMFNLYKKNENYKTKRNFNLKFCFAAITGNV